METNSLQLCEEDHKYKSCPTRYYGFIRAITDIFILSLARQSTQLLLHYVKIKLLSFRPLTAKHAAYVCAFFCYSRLTMVN